MSNIELKIRDVLNISPCPLQRCRYILSMFEIEALPEDQKKELLFYLFNSGAYTDLFKICLRRLKEKEQIPWAILCESLAFQSSPLPSALKKNLLKGAFREKKLSDIALSPSASSWGEPYKKNRERQFELSKKAYEKSRGKLKERLSYLKRAGLTKQTLKLIESELEMDPENKELKEQRARVKEIMAENVFDKYQFRYVDQVQHFEKRRKTKKEKESVEFIKKQIKNSIREKKASEINMALFFYFIEEPSMALEILEKSDKHISAEWLKLDILIFFEKYLDALEEIHKLEKKYSNEGEILFASCYIKAICYWGLNQKGKAIDTLKKLVEIKPNYRSAQALLDQWEVALNE